MLYDLIISDYDAYENSIKCRVLSHITGHKLNIIINKCKYCAIITYVNLVWENLKVNMC